MSTGEVQHRASDQEPGAMAGHKEGKGEEREPAEGLGPASGDDEAVRLAKVLEQLHRRQLSHHPRQLGQCGEDPDVEWRGLQEQGEGGEIIFTAALRGGLKGCVTEAIVPTHGLDVVSRGNEGPV